MNKVICLCTLLLTVGCAKAIFRPYVGDQQSWPTAEGSIVNVKHDLPIFTSLPPTPYDVLGEIRIESPFYEKPEEGHMDEVTTKAIEMGADAIVFVQGRIFFSTNYGPRGGDYVPDGKAPTLTQVNTFNPESFEPGVTVLAIRWIGEPPAGLPNISDTLGDVPEVVPLETEETDEVSPADPDAEMAPATEQIEDAPAPIEKMDPAEAAPAGESELAPEITPAPTNETPAQVEEDIDNDTTLPGEVGSEPMK